MIELAWLVLVRLSLVGGLTLALLLLLRRPLRHCFGARCAYAAWLLFPVVWVAAMLPASAPGQALQDQWVSAANPVLGTPIQALASPSHAGEAVLLSIWFGGLVLLATGLSLQQRRFMKRLQRAAGHEHWIAPAGSCPALVGLWNPRLSLPADFEQRFDPIERQLILAHEAVHRRRHDNGWNLLATGVACLQWFNPLAWLALRGMRADQELSCDAAVLLAAPDARALYARALFEAQASGSRSTSPLWASWHSVHPLVERVSMLNHPTLASAARRKAGLLFLTVMGLAGAGMVHALQPQDGPTQAPKFRMTVAIDWVENVGAGTERSTLEQTLLVGADEAIKMPLRAGAQQVDIRIADLGQGRLEIKARLSRGAPLLTLSEPRLIVGNGQPARIEMANPDGTHVTVDVTASTLPLADSVLR